jgi:Tfp pilus assembly protein PilF
MAVGLREDPMRLVVATLGLLLNMATAFAQDSPWGAHIEAGLQAFHQRQYAEAEQQLQAALTAAADMAPGDPRVSTTLLHLATLYHIQGKYTQAAPFYQHALILREQTLGPNHPKVAEVLEPYAALLRAMHPFRSAFPWSTAATMAARAQRILHPESPNVTNQDTQPLGRQNLSRWPTDEQEVFSDP